MRAHTLILLSLFVTVLVVTLVVPEVGAQTLEQRVQSLERQVDRLATTSLVLFLYGVFCALWAQRTDRSAWSWFFLGLFFGPITAIVVLAKNSNDRNNAHNLNELGT